MASRRSHAPTNASKWNNSRLGYAMGGCVATASRRSHAPSHSRTTTSQRSVPRGHVSIRNPLQALKERSCGISITSSSLGSAKRDLLSSSTSYGMRQSIFGELYIGGGILCTHSCAALQLAVGFMI